VQTQSSSRPKKGLRVRGGTTVLVVSILLVVGLVSLTAMFTGSGGSGAGLVDRDEYVVDRGSFEITVPASGELAALNQIEIRNRLEYRAVITEIVDEGTYVKKGDVLLRLAEDELETKIQDAEDAANTAGSSYIAAQSNLEIKTSASESDNQRAALDVRLAELALDGWRDGTVVSRRKELSLEHETALMDYTRLSEKFQESEVLLKQQFISQDNFKMDEINMIKAKARLEQSELATTVYEKYEYEQEKAQTESDVEQAVAERKRVAKRHKAELETARADVASKQHQLASRNERLKDLREQLVHCIVVAPSDGLVVYAASLETHRWSRGDRGDLQVGSEVRKNELVMVLPDVSQMTAEVKVNESLTGLIETGQRVIITSDAVPDVALEGKVISIGVLAESGGWRDPNRRDYTVKVLLTDTGDLGLKPSMRCKAEIYVGLVEDAIYVPLQAVFREGTGAYVYVPDSGGYAQRRVTLGKASGLHVAIATGLDAGERVLLREPKVREIVARLEDDPPPEGQAALGRPQGHRKGRGRPPRG